MQYLHHGYFLPKEGPTKSQITHCIDEMRPIAFRMIALSQGKTRKSILNQMIQNDLDDDGLDTLKRLLKSISMRPITIHQFPEMMSKPV